MIETWTRLFSCRPPEPGHYVARFSAEAAIVIATADYWLMEFEGSAIFPA
jgi:hypothetical protein